MNRTRFLENFNNIRRNDKGKTVVNDKMPYKQLLFRRKEVILTISCEDKNRCSLSKKKLVINNKKINRVLRLYERSFLSFFFFFQLLFPFANSPEKKKLFPEAKKHPVYIYLHPYPFAFSCIFSQYSFFLF